MRVLQIEGCKIVSINAKFNINKYTGSFFSKKEFKEFKNLLFLKTKKIDLDQNKYYKLNIYLRTYLDIDNSIKCIQDAVCDKNNINDNRILILNVVKIPIKRGSTHDTLIVAEIEEYNILDIFNLSDTQKVRDEFYQNIKIGKTSNESEINRTRRLAGLPPIKRGKINCIRCNELFFSNDTTNKKYCRKCRMAIDYLNGDLGNKNKREDDFYDEEAV